MSLFVGDHLRTTVCKEIEILICTFKIQSFFTRNQMEIFSALLVLWAGNSPVTGEFPSQNPVTRSFDVFVDLRFE